MGNEKEVILYDINDKINFLWSDVTRTNDNEWKTICLDAVVTLIALRAQILGLLNGEEDVTAD